MKHLPDWMKIAKIVTDNKTSFELSNGSQIKAGTTSGDAGRSEALSLLVIDEAAHVEGLDELWTGLYPTLSTGGRCIALSTPNGVGNWFHKTYVDADAEENDFHPILLPWDVHPERDEEWFRKETKNMSRRQIAQELECNFNTSGDTVIHPDDMQWLFDI
jgi:phage FluMu gp28-like protein